MKRTYLTNWHLHMDPKGLPIEPGTTVELDLSPEQEAVLVGDGRVLTLVDAGSSTPGESWKLADLRAHAESLGLDVSKARTKAAVLEVIEAHDAAEATAAAAAAEAAEAKGDDDKDVQSKTD